MQVFSTRTCERAIRKLLGEDARREMEEAIAVAPDAAPVIRGTGGIRKLRRAGRWVVVQHVFAKKSQRTPRWALATAREPDEPGDAMTKLKELKARLMRDPEFREEYARIDGEYALIEALVRARTAAKLTQAELARRLGTTQSAVARLEGGGYRRRSPRCGATPRRRGRG